MDWNAFWGDVMGEEGWCLPSVILRSPLEGFDAIEPDLIDEILVVTDREQDGIKSIAQQHDGTRDCRLENASSELISVPV